MRTILILLTVIVQTAFCQQVKILTGHSGNVNCLTFSPDGKTLISTGSDKKIIFWEIESGKNTKTLNTNSNCISADLSESGKYLVYTELDNGAYLLDLDKSTSTKILSSSDCYTASFSDDDRYISVTYFDETKETSYDQKGNEIKYSIYHYSSDIYSMEQKQIIERISVYDEEVHKISVPLFGSVSTGYRNKYFNSCFTRDTKYLIHANPKGNITIYSFQNKSLLRDFTGHEDNVYFVAVSPDNNYIASASKDETAKIWNISTGRSIKTLNGHDGDVNCVCFSPDSKYVATSSDDKTVRIWDVKKGNPIKTLKGFNNDVMYVAFSPDGKYIVAGGKDNKIHVWDAISILPELKLFSKEFELRVGLKSTLDKEMNEQISLIETNFEPKDEFETSEAFGTRLREKNEKIEGVRSFYRQKYEDLIKEKNAEFEVLKEDKQLEDMTVIEKSLRDTVMKITAVSYYNADEQTFGVTIKGVTKNVFVSLDKAPSFKENWKKATVKCKKQLTQDLRTYRYFDFVIIDPITKEEILFEEAKKK